MNWLEEEKDRIPQVALNNPRVQELVIRKRYTINSIGVWLSPAPEPRKIGGFVEISFDEPFFVDHAWPVVGYDKEKYGSNYIEGTVHEALWVKKLNVRVDLSRGIVVDITPLPL